MRRRTVWWSRGAWRSHGGEPQKRADPGTRVAHPVGMIRNGEATRRLSWLVAVFVALAALGATAGPAAAVGSDDANEQLFQHYCSACHGPTGAGDGPLAEILDPKPANLTTIAQRNGGTFPFGEVLKTIEGKNRVKGHGESSMPVWGEAFDVTARSPFKDRIELAGKLLLITIYIESIQKP